MESREKRESNRWKTEPAKGCSQERTIEGEWGSCEKKRSKLSRGKKINTLPVGERVQSVKNVQGGTQ